MLRYKINVFDALNRAGINVYKAKKTGVISQNTLYKLKNGDTRITLDTLDSICNILDLNPGDVIEFIRTEEDEKKLKNI